MLQSLVIKWLRWRYGGDVHDLKPPLGYAPKHLWKEWYKPSWKRRAAYFFSYRFYKLENMMFQKYGQPMRDNWEKNFR